MYLKVSSIFCSIFLYFKIAICFITPNEVSDDEIRFVKDDIEYLLFNIEVTWFEARLLCEIYRKGSLAILNNNKTSKFLAEAISEVDLELENLWIGAQKRRGAPNFKWINSDEILPNSYLTNRGEKYVNITRNCLSFNRMNHDISHFIDLECELQRPFICERVYEIKPNGSMTTNGWIYIGKYSYGIFYDQKTWSESAFECRKKHNAYLATFRNNMEVRLMAKFELIGRPSLENAWIGGYSINGVWKFISDGVIIPDTVDNTTLFPPWRKNTSRKHSGCLLLDRHLTSENTFFLEERCERKRSYICTREQKFADLEIFYLNNKIYYVYYSKKVWDDAFQTCNDMDTRLAKVTLENKPDITYIMKEISQEIKHIWISGKLSTDGSYFYWVYENERVPSNSAGLKFYPPWYDEEFDPSYACLNMDVENHNIGMFYGLPCETPQAFICEKDKNSLNDE